MPKKSRRRERAAPDVATQGMSSVLNDARAQGLIQPTMSPEGSLKSMAAPMLEQSAGLDGGGGRGVQMIKDLLAPCVVDAAAEAAIAALPMSDQV